MSKDVERITQINDQGEIIGGFVAVIRPKQKSAFQRHFTMNQDALRILAKELTGEQFKVLMLMLADLDYENFIQIAQADIAETLGMQKTNVSRAGTLHAISSGLSILHCSLPPQNPLRVLLPDLQNDRAATVPAAP